MPRKKLIRTSEFPYHVTSRSNNKEWFYIPCADVWNYMCDHVRVGTSQFNIKVHACVLMSNHYHIVLTTPESNIDKFMHYFNRELGKSISRQAGRINRIFGAPYKWSVIKKQNYYFNVLRYLYQNPVRAGLAKRCEEYPYSDILKRDWSEQMIEWINLKQPGYENIVLRNRLRKYTID